MAGTPLRQLPTIVLFHPQQQPSPLLFCLSTERVLLVISPVWWCPHHYLQLLLSLFVSQSSSVIRSCKSLGWNVRMCGRSPQEYTKRHLETWGSTGMPRSQLCPRESLCPWSPHRAPGEDTTLKYCSCGLLNQIGNYMHEKLPPISIRGWGRDFGRGQRAAGQRNFVHHFQGAFTWQ